MNKVSKYRKKPVVIEAMEWDGTSESAIAIINWANKSPGSIKYYSADESARGFVELVVPTLEGDMVARPGDFIIRGVQGEFYPCKPDIFRETYEDPDVKGGELTNEEKMERLKKAVLKLMHWSGNDMTDLIEYGLLNEGDLK
jgi:hypothetical protein